MSRRDRGVAFLVVVAIHLAAFAPAIGDYSSVIDRGFWHQGEEIVAGERPYSEVEFEYPPLALPLVAGPAAISDSLEGYREAFEAEMLAFDLIVVALLALVLPAAPRRVWESLAIYTAGVIAVSGVVLPDSKIEDAPLVLARFDLLPVALILAALIARAASRSALWGALLGAATAVKAFPAALFAPLFRDEPDPRRAAIAAAIPLAVAAALVLALGDEFASAVTYHTDRDLQIETVGAAPILVSHLLFGSGADVGIGAGGYNLVGSTADLARAISLGLLIAGALGLIYECWRRRTPRFVAATAILAVIVVPAPVLSPQFLLWVLPISAAAFGLGRENAVLLAAFVLTEIMLSNYDGVVDLSGDFVWTLAARNALLVAYLALVVVAVFSRSPRLAARTLRA